MAPPRLELGLPPHHPNASAARVEAAGDRTRSDLPCPSDTSPSPAAPALLPAVLLWLWLTVAPSVPLPVLSLQPCGASPSSK